MKRRTLFASVACVAGCVLVAQSPETYHDAYLAWQNAGGSLEIDAAKAGELLAVRTDAASPAAVKYEEARRAFFDSQSAPLKESAARLQPVPLPTESSSAKTADDLLTAQDAALAKNIAALAGDPDEGIRQLRQAMEKERTALTAIRDAASARKAAAASVETAGANAEKARTNAIEDINGLGSSFQQSADEEKRLAEAWPAYYRLLAEGARGKTTPGAPETISAVTPTVIPAPNAPASNASSSSANQPGRPSANAAASGAELANPAPVAPVARAASGAVQPPVPLARYTGSWGFAQGISTYSGSQPTMFDVIVKIDAGQVQGMLSAAFTVARSLDPTVKFAFNGPLQATRNQVFSLKMSDGSMGTVELIPGPAFNLLEVKFNLDAAPRRITTSDVTLLKK